MVKIFKAPETVELAMIEDSHEGQQVGSAAGVCNRSVKPQLLLQNEYLMRRAASAGPPDNSSRILDPPRVTLT